MRHPPHQCSIRRIDYLGVQRVGTAGSTGQDELKGHGRRASAYPLGPLDRQNGVEQRLGEYRGEIRTSADAKFAVGLLQVIVDGSL